MDTTKLGTGDISQSDPTYTVTTEAEASDVIEGQETGAVAADEKSCDSDEGSHDKDDLGNVGSQDVLSDERYAYLRRGFTTEIYKIEVLNLPQFVGYKVCPIHTTHSLHVCVCAIDSGHSKSLLPLRVQQLRKWFTNLKLKPAKIKLIQRGTCFVTFRSEEDRQVQVAQDKIKATGITFLIGNLVFVY